MNVVVLTNMAPFVSDGSEVLCDSLVFNLRQRGISAEALRIPFSWEPAERLIEEMLAARSLRLQNVDRVIVLKFPAYLVPWPTKVFWLEHQFRPAYDLWDTGQSNIPRDAAGEKIRAAIRAADNLAFAEAHAIFTVSPVISDRLRRHNGFDSMAMSVPLSDPEHFIGAPSEGYILATGRVGKAYRQHLLIEALRHAPGLRLVIAGVPETPQDAVKLRRLAEMAGVQDRLTLDLRCHSPPERAMLVNRALAAAYLPQDEGSVNHVMLEALQAAKPVLTTIDAAGALAAVRHGETGLVVEPTPKALGTAMQTLGANPGSAFSMGRAGRAQLEALSLTWATVTDRLLA